MEEKNQKNNHPSCTLYLTGMCTMYELDFSVLSLIDEPASAGSQRALRAGLL